MSASAKGVAFSTCRPQPTNKSVGTSRSESLSVCAFTLTLMPLIVASEPNAFKIAWRTRASLMVTTAQPMELCFLTSLCWPRSMSTWRRESSLRFVLSGFSNPPPLELLAISDLPLPFFPPLPTPFGPDSKSDESPLPGQRNPLPNSAMSPSLLGRWVLASAPLLLPVEPPKANSLPPPLPLVSDAPFPLDQPPLLPSFDAESFPSSFAPFAEPLLALLPQTWLACSTPLP
mmetsp:Transcript_105751/g.207384  ORF Transcript_105751/g.207384 Transcript_105751/m.207384 type:complete len:231 (-) Transcript_105751:258-950(-)